MFCNYDIENLTNLSNEAIQTLSSTYNTSQLTATNISATGTLSAGTNLTVGGNQTINGTSAVAGLTTLRGGLNANNTTLSGTTFINAGGVMPTTKLGSAGTGIYWNTHSGRGKTDLVNFGQGGGGGFDFWTLNNNNAPVKIGTLDGSGNLTISGNLNVKTMPQVFGAIMIDNGNGFYPIPCSLTSYIGMNDRDDAYILYPGYKIVIYKDGAYGGSSVTFDNTAGTVPTTYLMSGTPVGANNGSSSKLYYLENEVTINGLS